MDIGLDANWQWSSSKNANVLIHSLQLVTHNIMTVDAFIPFADNVF